VRLQVLACSPERLSFSQRFMLFGCILASNKHEKRLELINHDLRHRLKNLLTVIKLMRAKCETGRFQLGNKA
jgi:hypothetical protein